MKMRKPWALTPFFLCAVTALVASPAWAVDVNLIIDDHSANYAVPHVHPEGQIFSVDVTPDLSSVSSGQMYVQWVDPEENPLSPITPLTPNQTVTLASPSNQVGAYQLKFTTDSLNITYLPQTAGQKRLIGFSILHNETVNERNIDDDSFFGMVHADPNDPYMVGDIKTLTWNTLSASSFALRIKEYEGLKLRETPLISGTGWVSDDTLPLPSGFIDTFKNRFGSYLDSFHR